MDKNGDDRVIDAALIAAAQRVEHYEVSGYGTARTLASQLGHHEIANLLRQTEEEEVAADDKLTMVAVDEIYPSLKMMAGEEAQGASTSTGSRGNRPQMVSSER
jgi:ferritin-like metal-binding protein YciE